METLVIRFEECSAAVEADAELQHLQLVRLQDARSLHHLKLVTGAACDWPASLQCTLPASLFRIYVSVSVVHSW